MSPMNTVMLSGALLTLGGVVIASHGSDAANPRAGAAQGLVNAFADESESQRPAPAAVAPASEAPPKLPANPPDPAPAEATSSRASSPSLSTQLQLETTVLRPGSQTVNALLTLQAGEPPPSVERAPTAWALVVDVSWSMQGAKLDDARRAAKLLLEKLPQTDRVTVISFAHRARTLVDDMPVSEGRAAAVRAIDGLALDGSTCISCGMRAGERALARAARGMPRRMLVLTDGQANAGETRPQGLGRMASTLRRDGGVSVSAVGIGGGFSVAAVSAIAEGGGGTYHFAAHGDDLEEMARRELAQADTLAVRDLAIELTGDGASLVDDAQARLSLGAMAANTARRVVVPLKVNEGTVGRVLSAVISYRDAEGSTTLLTVEAQIEARSEDAAAIDASTQPAVVAYLQRLDAASAVEAALNAKRRGDTLGAVRVLDSALANLDANPLTRDDPDLVVEREELLKLKQQVTELQAKSAQLEAVSRMQSTRKSRARSGKKARRSKKKLKLNHAFF